MAEYDVVRNRESSSSDRKMILDGTLRGSRVVPVAGSGTLNVSFHMTALCASSNVFSVVRKTAKINC